MRHAFFFAILQAGRIYGSVFRAVLVDGWRTAPKRLLILAVAIPLLTLLQLVHWVGFLCDELFFGRYRQTTIHQPIFIVGIPRSGTTHLQRTLARDNRLTTMTLWECVFAPSITERWVVRSLSKLLAPLGKLLGKATPAFFGEMSAIHKIGLDEPEEDFLALLPIFSCFLLFVLFPTSQTIWRLSAFDSDLKPSHQQTILTFYERMVQKHLYFHGADLRYLSKNPSFTSWLRGLERQFTDAHFIVCTRDPAKTVPSQLSSLRPAMKVVGDGGFSAELQHNLINMLHHYYAHIQRQQLGSATVIPMQQLKSNFRPMLLQIYQQINLPLPSSDPISEQAEASKQYKSKHRYHLDDFGLTETQIKRQFHGVWPLEGRNDSIITTNSVAG